MAKTKVLFLSADASQRLRLDEEARAIKQMLDASPDRAAELHTAWAVRPEDIRKELLTHRPDIIHFSGHGAEDGAMVFKADDGSEKPVSPEALAGGQHVDVEMNHVRHHGGRRRAGVRRTCAPSGGRLVLRR